MKEPEGQEELLLVLHSLAAAIVLRELHEESEGDGVELHVENPRVVEVGGLGGSHRGC